MSKNIKKIYLYLIVPKNECNLPRVKREGVNRRRSKITLPDSSHEFNQESKKRPENVVTNELKFKDKKSGIMVLDNINLGIIEMLINNADIKSADIASKLKVPLSTIQRRRSNLEKNSILKKNYNVDLKRLGLRVAEISVSTKSGVSQNVIENFFNKHRRNIVNTALRIGNPDTNVSFRIVYTDSHELFDLLEEVKQIEGFSKVEWSEYITEKQNPSASIADLLKS
jgi:DNA-binding Lrp family transcriptional regulator